MHTRLIGFTTVGDLIANVQVLHRLQGRDRPNILRSAATVTFYYQILLSTPRKRVKSWNLWHRESAAPRSWLLTHMWSNRSWPDPICDVG